jgi:hypothetical protein
MSTTTGERTFSTSNREVVSSKPPPIPAGTYTAKLDVSGIEIGKADRPDAVPYVKIRFTAIGSALTPGGKDRKLFHLILLGLTPSPKDQKANVDRPGGLTQLAKALGVSFDGAAVEGVDGGPAEHVDPKSVVEWLKSLDGSEVQVKVKHEQGTEQYPDVKEKIAAFMAPV